MEMQMPQTGPEHETLARMAGEWVGEETMFPSPWSPEKMSMTSKLSARMLDGFFLVSDYEQSRDGEISFRGHGVYSWDPGTEEYLMYWFDSMGGAGGVARGTFEGDALTFENTSPMGEHRYRYEFGPNGTYTFEMSMKPEGGEWTTFMHGCYAPA